MSRRTQVLSQASSLFRLRGSHPVSPDFPFRSSIMSSCSFSTVLQPRSLDRFGLLPFRSPLLRESFLYFLFLQVLRCFSSLSLASLKLFFHFRIPGLYSGWVPPFGYRRLFACLLLTVAFRCLLRPSSPLCAQASAIRSFLLYLLVFLITLLFTFVSSVILFLVFDFSRKTSIIFLSRSLLFYRKFLLLSSFQ